MLAQAHFNVISGLKAASHDAIFRAPAHRDVMSPPHRGAINFQGALAVLEVRSVLFR